jgi:TRAP transporter TAXI family solute receptor
VKKIIALAGVFLMLSTVLAACGGGDSPGAGNGESGQVDTSQITIGAASQGGFWYALAGAYGNIIEEELDSTVAVVEGGSLANIEGIAGGQFQIGLANGQNVIEALEGFGGFEEPVSGFSGIAALYPNVNHIIVREDSDIRSISDLEGKRVSPGIKGYGGEVAFRQILELNDMSYDDLAQVEYIGTSDGANQLRDGQLDAIVTMLVTPIAVFEELDASVGVRLVPISDETVEGLQELNRGYIDYTIPKEVYGSEQDVQSIAAQTTVLVDENFPEDYVFDLTRILIENRDRWESMNAGMKDFDAEYSVSNIPDGLSLHPGAESYYEEINAFTRQETTQE